MDLATVSQSISNMQPTFTSISEKVGPVLVSLALAGTTSMALVQVLKTFGQTLFQRFALFQWLALGANPFASRRSNPLLQEMLFLAIGQRKHLNVLCGQDLPKMMGQLQAASKMALDNPDKYPHVYRFLVATDIDAVAGATTLREEDATAWRESVIRRSLRRGLAPAATQVVEPAITQVLVPAATQGPQNDAEVRSRIANLVSRKLDGFQLRTDFWWQTTCQVSAIVISIVLCVVALDQQGATTTISWGDKLVVGFFGGLLAPFIKDLSATVTSLASK
ncbi:MAG: hypothetical protein P4L87_14230 [Formivibrio sp.]|nr:hypothetical protein [Formivibrio sp.]